MRLSRSGGLDDGKALLCPLVSMVSGLDVPDVCFKGIATTANAHFGEVSTGVLCFGEPYKD